MRVYSLLLLLSLVAAAQTGAAVKYHATISDVKYVYGMGVPVAHVKSGEIIETNTLDAFGNALKKPGDRLSMVKGDNPLTGPFYIDGAQPGDTLAVRILDLQVDGNQGVGNLAPGFGALNQTTYTAMLHTPLPERIWFSRRHGCTTPQRTTSAARRRGSGRCCGLTRKNAGIALRTTLAAAAGPGSPARFSILLAGTQLAAALSAS